jgi:hypothetical protein
MGQGGWIVLSGFIGAASSFATTWLTAYLDRKSRYPEYDTAVVKLLRDMLKNGPKRRRLQTLRRVTGLSEKDVIEYLIELGARGSETDGDLWGLISRNPLPEADPSN